MLLAGCGILCKISELNVYDRFATYHGALVHFIIGVVCFLLTMCFIGWKEEFIKEPVLTWVRKKAIGEGRDILIVFYYILIYILYTLLYTTYLYFTVLLVA